jgi:hypothetical protein
VGSLALTRSCFPTAKGKRLRDEVKNRNSSPRCLVFVGTLDALTTDDPTTPLLLKERASVSCAGLVVLHHEIEAGGGVTIVDLMSSFVK